MKAETVESAVVELDVTKTFDLKIQGERIESLLNKVTRLQGDIEQRTSNCEANLRLLSNRRDGEIQQARDDYDLCLSRGDAVGMGTALKKIRTANKDLGILARQVQNSADDGDDLSARQKELRLAVFPLLSLAAENLELARKMDMQARQLLVLIEDSIGLKIRRLKSVINESMKLGGQILSGEEKP